MTWGNHAWVYHQRMTGRGFACRVETRGGKALKHFDYLGKHPFDGMIIKVGKFTYSPSWALTSSQRFLAVGAGLMCHYNVAVSNHVNRFCDFCIHLKFFRKENRFRV
jgi:hypothetical protein